MTQTYSSEQARSRMAAGNCPECGNPPEQHPSQSISMLYAGVCGFGGLLREGVEDRIAQYRREEAACAE